MTLIMNVIFSLIIWGSICFAGYKVFLKSLSEQKIIKSTKISAVQIGLYSFLFRIIVYIISAILITYHNGGISISEFLEQWQRWDATNYIRIAEGWYNGYTENGDFLTLVFFPLYPVLARALYVLVPNINIALMVTSSVAYAVGCGYMYELVRVDFSEKVARNSVIWISVFPFAFFFGALMTESTFFMTTAMTFYYIRKHNWLLVGICGALSAFSRMIGIFVIVPAFIEWLDYYKPFYKGWKEFWKCCIKFLPSCIMIAGILGYLAINYSVAGNPFKFMEYQHKYWYHQTCYFGKTLGDIFSYALALKTDTVTRISIWIPSAVIFSTAAILLIYSAYYYRSMYTIYLAGYIVINCSVTWLISGPRYMSAALPLFIIIGAVTSEKKILNILLLCASFVLMIIYLYRYLFNMQVM